MKKTKIAFVFTLFLGLALPCAVAELNKDIRLHERVDPISVPMGPFVHLGEEGCFLTVDRHHALITRDAGKNWERHPLFDDNRKHAVRPERALVRTEDGTVILAFMNDVERDWRWDTSKVDAVGSRLPTYTIRSVDNGETWQDLQMLHEEWTGAIRNMIQTTAGDVVFTSMMLLHDPGRHATVTYRSSDEGETWRRSNIIDLGGAGNHDGAKEATIEELSDGRLWMLIRTNWDYFWEAYSNDGGRYWRVIKPTGIDASSAPGLLARLASGRLTLVWNRLLPEGHTDFPRIGGDSNWSEVPTINHRWELSIAFSEDDGRTWSVPVILGHAKEPMSDRNLSYPYLFEPRPGEIWITTMIGGLRIRFMEEDLIVDPGTVNFENSTNMLPLR